MRKKPGSYLYSFFSCSTCHPLQQGKLPIKPMTSPAYPQDLMEQLKKEQKKLILFLTLFPPPVFQELS